MTLAKSLPTSSEALPGQAAGLTAAPVLGGLPPQTLAQIQVVLQAFPQIRWLKLYGSRAMGTTGPVPTLTWLSVVPLIARPS